MPGTEGLPAARGDIRARRQRRPQDRPYLVTEHNYTIELLQPAIPRRPDGPQNYHAVLLTHPRESVTAHYERARYPVAGELRADPRITHDLILAADDYGNPLRSASAGYGRRYPDPELAPADQAAQARLRLSYTETGYTNAVELPDAHRMPLPARTRTYEIVGPAPRRTARRLFGFAELADALAAIAAELPFRTGTPTGPRSPGPRRRLTGHSRSATGGTTCPDRCPTGCWSPRAAPYRSYQQAFTYSLAAEPLRRPGRRRNARPPAGVPRGTARHCWLPSGQVFYSPGEHDDPAAELAYARRHFFRPHRFRDPSATPPPSPTTGTTCWWRRPAIPSAIWSRPVSATPATGGSPAATTTGSSRRTCSATPTATARRPPSMPWAGSRHGRDGQAGGATGVTPWPGSTPTRPGRGAAFFADPLTRAGTCSAGPPSG